MLQHSTVNHGARRRLSLAPDLSRCAHSGVQMCSWNAYLPTSWLDSWLQRDLGLKYFFRQPPKRIILHDNKVHIKHSWLVKVLHQNHVVKWRTKLALSVKSPTNPNLSLSQTCWWIFYKQSFRMYSSWCMSYALEV